MNDDVKTGDTSTPEAAADEHHREAVEANPDDIEVYNDKGNALFYERKYDEAIEQYQKALYVDPEFVEAFYNWGNALFEQKKYEEAIEQYRKALEVNPDYSDAYFNWGNVLSEQKKYEEAIEQYRKAVKVNPDYSDAYYNWGNALSKQKKFEEAIEQYRKAVQVNPDDTDAYINWGNALSEQRKYDEAIEQYRKAVDVNPDDSLVYNDWGIALYEQKKYDEAMEQYRNAIGKDPDNAYAFHNIADCLQELGDFRRSKGAYKDACIVYGRRLPVAREEGNSEFFHYYGSILLNEYGDLDNAEKILTEGLYLDRLHAGILSRLASLNLERHSIIRAIDDVSNQGPKIFAKAREYFAKAERILKQRLEKDEDAETLLELGNHYLLMDEIDEARKCIERSVAKDENTSDAYVSLGVVCSREGQFQQAIRYFEKIHKRKPYDFNVWSNLAEAYFNSNPNDQKQIEKAEYEFKQILRIAPEHIDSLIGLGEVYSALGDISDKEYYSMAIERYDKVIQLADTDNGSKRLLKNQLAAVYYSRGYARVKLYEASLPFVSESLLSSALKDFRKCCASDRNHASAEAARRKLEGRLTKSSNRFILKKVAPWLVLLPSFFVFTLSQLNFYFGIPAGQDSINTVSYIGLTFGSLIFLVVGLFLPELQKLKAAGIEMEKSTTSQISPVGPLGLKKVTSLTQNRT